MRPRRIENPPKRKAKAKRVKPSAKPKARTKKPEPTAKKRPRASSLKHAAGILGYPLSVFAEAKRLGCEAIDGHNRVDIQGFKAWVKANAERLEKKDENVSKETAEIRKILKQCERLDLQNAVIRGEYIKADDVAEAIFAIGDQQKRVLRQKLEQEAPPRLEGLRAPEIQARMCTIVDEICDIFSAGTEKWTPEE